MTLSTALLPLAGSAARQVLEQVAGTVKNGLAFAASLTAPTATPSASVSPPSDTDNDAALTASADGRLVQWRAAWQNLEREANALAQVLRERLAASDVDLADPIARAPMRTAAFWPLAVIGTALAWRSSLKTTRNWPRRYGIFCSVWPRTRKRPAATPLACKWSSTRRPCRLPGPPPWACDRRNRCSSEIFPHRLAIGSLLDKLHGPWDYRPQSGLFSANSWVSCPRRLQVGERCHARMCETYRQHQLGKSPRP